MDKHQFGMLSIERPLVWSSDRQTCRMYFFGILEFFTTHGSSISIYLVVDEKCIYKQAVFKPRVRSNKICLTQDLSSSSCHHIVSSHKTIFCSLVAVKPPVTSQEGVWTPNTRARLPSWKLSPGLQLNFMSVSCNQVIAHYHCVEERLNGSRNRNLM